MLREFFYRYYSLLEMLLRLWIVLPLAEVRQPLLFYQSRSLKIALQDLPEQMQIVLKSRVVSCVCLLLFTLELSDNC